eukprot:CAMPEP_0113431370 /NCGR_PEP_ID=MMETSP0013_2-20120614/33549_1 /TAXON_ID=2843 ORGANISM="Skeletonema costatum, Strain 1716" /NCGR_SAMPLE_ID=MMETSP0013_2 /ASSEMBLY_ACC=CAM_ASM_000158 /LENGTH=1481 /DNA_ID=CAMNT_0000320359 /DNA_START=19 /DNA_END=4464 /DNA_ORIENTATION=+ /assembly_acc=CAM_ASM_000158
MPKTPESGGIPLPYSWPPFNRDVWDDRAESLLESLGRMGHELEGYIVVPAVNSVGEYVPPKQEADSSLSVAAAESDTAADNTAGGEDGKQPKKTTKPLITYEQRRKFITKSMDLHRHTVGGGRSGRRGRAEVVAFLRYTLDKLDEKQQEAMEEGDELDIEQMERDGMGRFMGKKEGDSSSSSEEEEEVVEEEAAAKEEDEEEAVEEDEDYEERPKKRRPGRPARKTTKLPDSSTASAPPKKDKPPQKMMSEEEFLEQHNDLCEVCNTPGELLCCATCNLVFHVECARPKITSMEEAPDDWKCAYCWAAGVMGGKKDGKDRRKAAQAVREMERAKRDLKEKKGGRPLSKKTIEKEVEAAVEAAINSVDGKATLAEAAAAGCRKCKKELDSGEKTRKTHDDHCPRKWRSVGKPPGTEVVDIALPVKEESKPKPVRSAWHVRSLSPPKSNRSLSPPKQRGRSRTPEPDATQSTSTNARGRPRRPRSQPPAQIESIDVGGVTGANRPPLEVGAAAGCVKCQRELDTGEKTRKTHDDHCPRKFKGVGRTARWQQGPKATPAVSRKALKQEHVEEDQGEQVKVHVTKKEKAPRVCQMEGCNKLKQYNCEGYCMRHYRQVVLEGQQEETEEEVKEEEEEEVEASEEEEEEEEEVIERPSKICRLDGCTKLKQYNCDGYCMRHYRQYVLEGQQKEEEEKEEDEAKEEVVEEEEAQKEEAELEEEETSEKDEEKEEVTEEDDEREDVTEEDEENKEEVTEEEKVKEEAVEEEEVEGEEEEEKAETIAEEVKEEKTRVCKYAECNKYKQYNCDGYCMRHYRQVVLEGGAAEKEEEKEEEVETETGDDVAVGGDVAEDEVVPDGAKSISPAPTSESSPAKVEKDENMVETQIDVSEKKKPAQRTFPAPPTLEEAAAAGCKKCRLEFETGEKTRKTHNDNCPRKWKSAGKPPPGIPAPTAGRKKRVQSPARSSQSMEEDESAVAALVAVAAATANTRRSDRSAVTPKAEESSTRIRRERKKPTVYSPQEGVPDREWQPDGSSTSPQKKVGKKTEKKDEVPVPPKPKRGRPSRADIAAREAYAAYVAKSKSPPPKERKKPGPKPKREKEKEKKPPPKKATPPKKGPVIKPDTEGVGVLNRLPGTLFDCSACLDINKIKLCCYCACRVCFNKFGKERTILCDKCDQEYHTFCVGLDKIPEGEWVCIACIEDEKKQKILAQRRKEREARKKIEDEKRALEEAKKAVLSAERKKKFAEKKAIENEKKRVASEQRRIAAEKRRIKDAELRAHGIPIKRGPGRPRKDEQRLLAALAQHPQKRGRGRPRKDGKDPIPRKFMSKYEISAENVYFDEESELTAAQRSRSGRKIQRTIFHDEVDHPGLMKKARTDEYMGGYEKGATAGGKGSGKSASGKKEGRRKPGARECMQLTKKFDDTPIDEQSFDVLMDYSKRGKVDHLIRMRERLDDHSRFLEAQLAGLEALVKEKGELNIVCPPKSD